MTLARLVSSLFLVMAIAPACGPRPIRSGSQPTQQPSPSPSGHDLIVLLPDSDGTVGRAIVSNASGTLDLAEAHATARVTRGKAPTLVQNISEQDTQAIFGAALAALPEPPQHFVLFFRFESGELTDESRALVPAVVQMVKSRPGPDVTVLGHTDTAGAATSNFELGLRRANVVRTLLVDGGIDASAVQVVSHGEAEPLVHTADEVFEPRNRRVEITVR